jgi:hypothetical protein
MIPIIGAISQTYLVRSTQGEREKPEGGTIMKE